MPRAALAVKPWQAHEASLDPVLQPGSDDLKSLLAQMREDILARLDCQDSVLNQLVHKSDHVRRLVPQHPRPKVVSPVGRHGEPRSASSSPVEGRFRTFEDEDLAHLDAAHTATAKVARDRFKEAKTMIDGSHPHVNFLRRIVKSNGFDVFCALVVVTNSVFLGIEVQASVTYEGSVPEGLIWARYIYTVWFVLELALRLWADGVRQFLCSADWLWGALDVFVVVTSLWEIVADVAYALLQNDDIEVASMAGLKAFRIIRITRIVKAVRLMRVFRFVMAFRTLITSILYTLKSLFWALMLLVVIVYVFGVLFTQAVNDFKLDYADQVLPLTQREKDLSERYFVSLQDTMLSLYMSIAGGVSWEDVITPLRAVSEFWAFLFLFYISFTYFAVLNVVTGVFCQSAIESAQNDHTAVVHSILKNKQAHVEKIKALFNELGDEKSAAITFAMFEEKINSPAVQAYFEVLGLDVSDAWSFFKLLDLDDGGDVEVEEFLMGCLRLRGPAKAIDVGKVIHDQTWLIRTQGKFITFVEDELSRISGQLDALTGSLSEAGEAHAAVGTGSREPAGKSQDAQKAI